MNEHTDYGSASTQNDAGRPSKDKGKGRKTSRLLGVTGVGVVLAGVLLAIGYVPRSQNARAAESAAVERKNAVPEVATYVVRAGNPASPLLLPGNIEPITDAVIYARIDGYVERRLVDIGDRVSAGELLAIISSPETDQELHVAEQALEQSKSNFTAAKADTESAKANLFIAEVTNRRWQDLVLRSVVSQEEADQTQSTYLARKADVFAAVSRQMAAGDAVRASEHRVQRLKQLASYERVVAPFPGVITQRSIDIGSLITAGSNSSVPVLYHLARLNRMRIFVDVPQSDAEYVHIGQDSAVQVRELDNRVFKGEVTRFAGALDLGSRTMRTEVQLPNPKGELLPGMFTWVRFGFIRKEPPIIIPANTLIASPSGDQVAIVRHGIAHFETIQVAQDYGPEVEILGGVSIGDRLVVNVNDQVRNGSPVKVVGPK
jgi:RND family efflux transporter MFP subunit